MSVAEKLSLLSIEDYLAAELVSDEKHEYLGGVVYAMTGASNRHNTISGNVFASLHTRLRGKPCRPFNSDTKIRVSLPQVRFYYPDMSVVCQPRDPADSYQEDPKLLVEVLSRRTRRIDEGEKKDVYLGLPSLAVYLLIEQEFAAVVVLRRNDSGFAREVYQGINAIVPIPELGMELPLNEVYETVDFAAEAESQG